MSAICLTCVAILLTQVAEKPMEMQTLVFRVDDPQSFERSLPPSAIEPKSSSPLVAAVDGARLMKIAKGDATVEIASELVLLSEPLKGNCYFQMNSVPMSMPSATKSFRGLCKMLGSNDAGLDDWIAKGAHEKRSFEKHFRVEKQSFSVELRNSLRDDLPWVVHLEVGFDRK